jgi:hypothetical protein
MSAPTATTLTARMRKNPSRGLLLETESVATCVSEKQKMERNPHLSREAATK